MPTSTSNIRVAIMGGGVAGASLMHALLQYPHIDAHIFEAASKFKEAGVAFGVTRNAQKALELIGPSARQCLDQAGGVQMQSVRIRVGQGKDAGKQVYQADADQQTNLKTTSIVQRADFLREFLAIIPDERLHASKKLVRYERAQDGSLTLYFTDGTTHECDILIGADGIHSTVRKSILGADDPAASPKNTGWWCLMTLQPYDKAKAAFGEFVQASEARENNWIADGRFYLVNISGGGTTAQFSVVAKDRKAEDSQEWQKVVTAEEVRQIFHQEGQLPVVNKAVTELLCDQPEHQAIYFWEHPPARTYVDGPVAVTGDAAHSTTAFQGSGGSFSLEDSMILSALLGHAQSPKEAEIALTVFDQVRRPRTQKLVRTSNATGAMVTGQSEYGIDAERLKKALEPNWDWIIDFDNEKHRDEALRMMDEELKAL